MWETRYVLYCNDVAAIVCAGVTGPATVSFTFSIEYIVVAVVALAVTYVSCSGLNYCSGSCNI